MCYSGLLSINGKINIRTCPDFHLLLDNFKSGRVGILIYQCRILNPDTSGVQLRPCPDFNFSIAKFQIWTHPNFDFGHVWISIFQLKNFKYGHVRILILDFGFYPWNIKLSRFVFKKFPGNVQDPDRKSSFSRKMR